jgi:NADH dehydrogenase (ubiquinone) 1 alpha subcomplex subunit 13
MFSFSGVTAGSAYLYYLNCLQNERETIEMRSGKMALYPLLFAERDREYLKQIRRNRDEEADLMKNVPGWKVGTWYGEPVFKTIPKDTIVDAHWQDFCAHASTKKMTDRSYFHLYN